MADYSSMQNAIDAGITNMTVIRNNTAQDDNYDTISTDVDWFYFNSRKVDKIYVSGNSWLGFSSSTSTENLRVNRRDAKMYYLYKEHGTIGTVKFLKIRWQGYSNYSYTSFTYAQAFDVFILDDGRIVLLFDTIPSSSFSGTNQLVCGTQTVNFTPSTSSRNFTFTASDLQNGSGWSVEEGYPEITANYKTSGSVTFSTSKVNSVKTVKSSIISWNSNEPDGTSIKVYTKLNDGEYTECTNNSVIPVISEGASLLNSTLYIKVDLSTNNKAVTPVLSSLNVKVYDISDDKVLLLSFGSGNKNNIQNAVGEISVLYAGGTLQGDGGMVAAFSKTFNPEGLIPKTNQNMLEHIELADIKATANLINIGYVNSKTDEHIEVSNVSAVGTLTHVNDI